MEKITNQVVTLPPVPVAPSVWYGRSATPPRRLPHRVRYNSSQLHNSPSNLKSH